MVNTMKMNSNRFKESIKSILQKIRLRYLANIDIVRFSKSASFSTYDNNYDQICSRIIYNVHAIEKGMSHEENLRLGFGKKALSNLNDALVVYLKSNFSKQSFAYIQGVSIIKSYVDFHDNYNFRCDFLKEIIDPKIIEEANKVDIMKSGIKIVRLKDKLNNDVLNFEELALNRTSIREFSGEPVDLDLIKKSIKIALKTPSVCNRQGWNALVVSNKETIKTLLNLQRGFKGYPRLPEILIVVSTSNSTFLSPVERNEAFVDGGLFSMSLLYALESLSLAAVPLNAMMNSKDEKEIRKVTQIDGANQIIMFIAVGKFKDRTAVPVSERKSVNDITRYI